MLSGEPGLKPGADATMWENRDDDWVNSLYWWTVINLQQMISGQEYLLIYWLAQIFQIITGEDIPLAPYSESVDFFYMSYDYMLEYLGWYTFSFPIYYFVSVVIFLLTFPMYNVQWQFRELAHYNDN